MNRVGMVVDVSHCGDRTTLEPSTLSKNRADHALDCRVLVNGHPRLQDRRAIRKMARRAESWASLACDVREGGRATTIEHVPIHFDQFAKLVGPEFLGVGSDIRSVATTRCLPTSAPPYNANYKSVYAFPRQGTTLMHQSPRAC